MKLYHGTAEHHLEAILKEGIKPRGKDKSGNWKHTIESNPDFVYLTNAYALYFAGNATKDKSRLAVLEIDVRMLNPFRLAPDEDWLEQATRKVNEPWSAPTDKGMKYRTRWYRRRLKQLCGGDLWEQSIDGMGTCTHYGTVPLPAIRRVALIDHSAYHRLLFGGGLDPMINIMNYRIVGDKYRNASAWLFDGTEPPPDGYTFSNLQLTEQQRAEREAAKAQVWVRDGIEVLDVQLAHA